MRLSRPPSEGQGRPSVQPALRMKMRMKKPIELLAGGHQRRLGNPWPLSIPWVLLQRPGAHTALGPRQTALTEEWTSLPAAGWWTEMWPICPALKSGLQALQCVHAYLLYTPYMLHHSPLTPCKHLFPHKLLFNRTLYVHTVHTYVRQSGWLRRPSVTTTGGGAWRCVRRERDNLIYVDI